MYVDYLESVCYVDLTHPNVHTINCVSGLVAALHSVEAITSNGTFYDIPFEKDHTFFFFPNIFLTVASMQLIAIVMRMLERFSYFMENEIFCRSDILFKKSF